MLRTVTEYALLYSVRNTAVWKRKKPGESERTQPVSGNRSIYGIINQLGEVDKGKSVEKLKIPVRAI
jgi:hypothetical protein